MEKKKIDIPSALTLGWEIFQKNTRLLLIATFIVFSLSAISMLISMFLKSSIADPAQRDIVRLLFNIFLQYPASFVVALGIMNISLRLVKNEEVGVNHIIVSAPQLITYFISSFILGFMIFGGLLLLVIPGIIIAIAFSFVGYIILEEGLAPIEALRKSYHLTLGAKFQIFLFNLVSASLIIAGYLACGIGFFVAFPVVSIAGAVIYLQLKSQLEDVNKPPKLKM